jgi:hypothetical protein
VLVSVRLTYTDIPGTTGTTAPGTVPMVMRDVTAKATFWPICQETQSVNCSGVPTVIPGFDCGVTPAITDKLIRQTNSMSTLGMSLRPTATMNRAAVCRVVVRPT